MHCVGGGIARTGAHSPATNHPLSWRNHLPLPHTRALCHHSYSQLGWIGWASGFIKLRCRQCPVLPCVAATIAPLCIGAGLTAHAFFTPPSITPQRVATASPRNASCRPLGLAATDSHTLLHRAMTRFAARPNVHCLFCVSCCHHCRNPHSSSNPLWNLSPRINCFVGCVWSIGPFGCRAQQGCGQRARAQTHCWHTRVSACHVRHEHAGDAHRLRARWRWPSERAH